MLLNKFATEQISAFGDFLGGGRKGTLTAIILYAFGDVFIGCLKPELVLS